MRPTAIIHNLASPRAGSQAPGRPLWYIVRVLDQHGTELVRGLFLAARAGLKLPAAGHSRGARTGSSPESELAAPNVPSPPRPHSRNSRAAQTL